VALIPRGEMSIVLAGLGVGAGIQSDLAPLAAGYVLVLAIAGPIVMRFPHAVVPRARSVRGDVKLRGASRSPRVVRPRS
jgi:CPA2 family monovalent cation:H+ antiporter-2